MNIIVSCVIYVIDHQITFKWKSEVHAHSKALAIVSCHQMHQYL